MRPIRNSGIGAQASVGAAFPMPAICRKGAMGRNGANPVSPNGASLIGETLAFVSDPVNR